MATSPENATNVIGFCPASTGRVPHASLVQTPGSIMSAPGTFCGVAQVVRSARFGPTLSQRLVLVAR